MLWYEDACEAADGLRSLFGCIGWESDRARDGGLETSDGGDGAVLDRRRQLATKPAAQSMPLPSFRRLRLSITTLDFPLPRNGILNVGTLLAVETTGSADFRPFWHYTFALPFPTSIARSLSPSSRDRRLDHGLLILLRGGRSVRQRRLAKIRGSRDASGRHGVGKNSDSHDD